MLELHHLVTAAQAHPLAPAADALGIVAYGTPLPADAAVDVHVAARCLGSGDSALEIWRGSAGPISGQRGDVHYRHDGSCLFGCLALDETRFAADAECGALQRATEAAYTQIFALLAQLDFPQLWRVWNFIPRINAEEAGLERYRHFNIARQSAFAVSGRATAGAVPAASAVGSGGPQLVIYFFAGRQAPLAIENPRQVSAYHYPAAYGPRSPVFARASLIDTGAQELLFISGTASIVGHRTLHAGDAAAQTRELLANLDCVLGEANGRTQRRRFARHDLAYKVYLRQPGDCAAVQTELQRWHGGAARALYVQADICRSDLLVEIEASGGHTIGHGAP